MPPLSPKSPRQKSAGTAAGKGKHSRAATGLWQGEETYRALFKDMPVPLQAVDEDARLLEVNNAWLKLLGYSREEVIGRPLTAFYTPESARHFDEVGWPELLKAGEIHNLERQLCCKSGAIIPVLLSGSIERDSVGRFLRGYGVLVDISARRKLERERDRYFEMSEDFLAIARLDGAIHDVNPAIIKATGLGREEILARPSFEFLHPDDRPAADAAMRRLAAGDRVVDVEVCYRHHDTTWHWSAFRSTSVAEEGVIFSIERDVHEQRPTEEVLRRSERLEAIGQLTGGIAHHFNNLLTIVVGNLDRIISRSAEEPIKRLAESALAGAERGRLTKHLLAFARRQRLAPQLLQLDEMLHRMEALYRRGGGEAVELSFSLTPGLWPCRGPRAP